MCCGGGKKRSQDKEQDKDKGQDVIPSRSVREKPNPSPKKMPEAGEASDPEGMKMKNFMIGKFIAKGSFGRVHIGHNIKTNEAVVIKMELKSVDKPQLPFEFRFYKLLNAENKSHKGIPKIHYFGPCGEWSALVMDALGPSLEKVHQDCNGKFSFKTTCMLGIQLVDIFEYFHGCRLIFRDTKPENFLFGAPGSEKYSIVHIIDLGLSKEYKDEKTGKHIDFVTGKGVTGTVRYMSINNHRGVEASRRDDLIATAYMLIYFCKTELPWMGVQASSVKEKYKKIAKIKEQTKPENLCSDIPKELGAYLKAVSELEFDETPKYGQYRTLFETCLKNNGQKNDANYDFDKNHKLKAARSQW